MARPVLELRDQCLGLAAPPGLPCLGGGSFLRKAGFGQLSFPDNWISISVSAQRTNSSPCLDSLTADFTNSWFSLKIRKSLLGQELVTPFPELPHIKAAAGWFRFCPAHTCRLPSSWVFFH